jgi:hypothetical protein
MKKILLLITFLIIKNVVIAQQANSLPYTESNLMGMTKLKLSEIYLQQVDVFAQAIPYAAFTLQTGSPSDSLKSNLDIPQSKYLKGKRADLQKTSIGYGKVVKETLFEIIPYSDKANIIKAILYFQEINSMLKKPGKP